VEPEKGRFFPRVYSVACFDFIDEHGITQRVTAIIAPIRVKAAEDGSTVISYACSRGPRCRNPTCRYSSR